MDDDALPDVLTTALTRADRFDRQGRGLAARQDIGAAAEAWTEAAAASRTAVAYLVLELAELLERAAAAHAKAGHAEAALPLAEAARAQLRGARIAGNAPLPALASRLSSLGHLFCVMRRWDAAVAVLAEAETWFAEQPDPALARQRLQSLDVLATAHRFAGRPEQAITVLEGALSRSTPLAREDAALEDRLEVARIRNSLGQVLLESGAAAAAVGVLGQCVAGVQAIVAEAPAEPIRNLLAAALNKLGHAQAAVGDRAAALASLEESVTLMRVLVEKDGITAFAEDLATAEADLRRLAATADVPGK